MTTIATAAILTFNKRTIMEGNATFHASKRLATIVAVLTLGSWFFTPHSQAVGVWTNEPAGAKVLLDCPFSGSICQLFSVYGNLPFSTDSSGPISPTGILDEVLEAGAGDWRRTICLRLSTCPDIRWVGTETGYGRETEWSVVHVNNLNQTTIAAGSQKDIAFKPQGGMRGDDLGSREKIVNAKRLVWYPAETDVSIRPGWFYHEAEDSKVKSPGKLLDIYFNSVGRNGVLLLNIPPDKRGLIHESDIAALKQWKQLRDEIFKTNLAKSSVIKSVNGVNTKYRLDGNNATHFTTRGNGTATVIERQNSEFRGQNSEFRGQNSEGRR